MQSANSSNVCNVEVIFNFNLGNVLSLNLFDGRNFFFLIVFNLLLLLACKFGSSHFLRLGFLLRFNQQALVALSFRLFVFWCFRSFIFFRVFFRLRSIFIGVLLFTILQPLDEVFNEGLELLFGLLVF